MKLFAVPFKVKVHNVSLRERPFEIEESFEFYSKRYKILINIPKGYRTNFASVPRIFWIIVPPIGKYNKATVIHDYLVDNIDKYDLNIHQVNRLFKEALEVSGVNWVYKGIMYLSVEFYWRFGVYISRFIKKLFGIELIK